MRESVRRFVEREGVRLKHAAPKVIVASLVAAACVPIVLPLVGAGAGGIGAVAGGVFAVLQDYGKGYLSDFVKGWIDGLGPDAPSEELSASTVQAQLERELLAQLEAGDVRALALRDEMSLLLRAVGGVQVALEAASGDVKAALAKGFAELGATLEEFRWMLGEVQYTLIDIRDTQSEQLALQRGQHDLLREQLVKLNFLISVQEEAEAPAHAVALDGPHTGERPPPAAVPCPFKGLAAFQPEDADYFFGREELVATLTTRLAETPFLGVVGPSGSGKSSVVRAGLLPALWKGALHASSRWKTMIMTPGGNPLDELAVRIPVLRGLASVSLARDLREDPHALRLALRQVLVDEPEDVRLLLVVDQFEEVFTLCRDEAERRCFIDALVEAVGADRWVLIVLAIRADFYGRCAAYPRLAALLQDNQALVSPMSEAELRQIIERPAARAGLIVEPGLEEAIVRDVADEPGALPLLSHALLETWKRREGRTLTLAGYTDSGGVREAITTTADSVFVQQLSPAQQTIARGIFLRLTELGEGTEDTRRRAARAELSTNLGGEADVEAVLDRLVDARLVTTVDDAVEVAHEALIREWPTLRQWLNENREGLRIHRHLTRAAQEWTARKDPDELYRGSRLATATEWAKDHATDLNPLEQQFLTASTARQRTELDRQRRQNRRLRLLATGLSALLVGALVSATFAVDRSRLAVRQSRLAKEQRQESISRQLAAQAVSNLARQPGLAMLLSLEAVRTDDIPDARSSLLAGLQRDPRLAGFMPTPYHVTSIAVTRDGRSVVVGDDDGGISLWDARHRRITGTRFQGHRGAVLAVALGPDDQTVTSVASVDRAVLQWTPGPQQAQPGLPLPVHDVRVRSATFDRGARRVAVGGEDGAVSLWDVQQRRRLWRRPLGSGGPVLAVAVSNDGRLLAAGNRAGEIALFDADSGTSRGRWPISHPADGSVTSLAFAPDQHTLISGTTSGPLSGWDIKRRALQYRLLGHTGLVVSLAISRNGRTLASGSFDNSVRLWDLALGRSIGEPLVAHTGPVRGLAFGRTDDVLLSGGNEGDIVRWDLRALPRLATPLPSTTPMTKVWFRQEGRAVASGGADGSLRLWDVRQRAPTGTFRASLRGPGASVVAFHPDARTVAHSGPQGSVRLWDVRQRGPVGPPLPGPRRPTTALVFSPDGRRLAAGNGDGTVTVWDLQRRQPIAVPRGGHAGRVRTLAFTPTGGTLASGGVDGQIHLWDLASGGHSELRWEHAGAIRSLLFDPEGRTLAAGDGYGSVTLWENAVPGAKPRRQLLGRHTGAVSSLAFRADGEELASGGADGKVLLWDVPRRQELGDGFAGHANLVTSLAFSPDGRTLVSGGGDSRLLLWDLDPRSWERRVCSIVRRSLRPAEWQAFISDQPYRRTCE
jgi:WD40 repeat protein